LSALASRQKRVTKNFFEISDKKVVGKSKAEQMNERQQELERRLQDVTGQLGSGKKSAKKGRISRSNSIARSLIWFLLFLQMIPIKQMHKHPTANRRQVVLVIRPLQVHLTAVLVTVPTAKQVRRMLKLASTLKF
jgi:hypothetical protein